MLSRNTTLQHLITQFPLHYLSSGRLREVKNKRKFQTLGSKSGRVPYERWPRTRGSKYSDLTWKILVVWKTGRGRLREAVATAGSTVISFHGYLSFPARNRTKIEYLYILFN